MDNETYLGDGLYASHDGWQFKLRAPQDAGGDHYVYLEPAVLAAFQRYIKQVEDNYDPTPADDGRAWPQADNE